MCFNQYNSSQLFKMIIFIIASSFQCAYDFVQIWYLKSRLEQWIHWQKTYLRDLFKMETNQFWSVLCMSFKISVIKLQFINIFIFRLWRHENGYKKKLFSTGMISICLKLRCLYNLQVLISQMSNYQHLIWKTHISNVGK